MILPQLQEALVVASDQMVARQRRRTQRFRLGLMTSAAVVTLGGGAVASQSLWAPLLGWEDGNRPTATDEPAPAEQRAVLGVLRRDQVAADRSGTSQAALRLLVRRYEGVRVADVRVLTPADGGTPTVLVPVAKVGDRPVVPDRPVAQALCVHTGPGPAADPSVPLMSSRQCFTTTTVRQSRAVFTFDVGLRGLVPDGVARVRFEGPGHRPYEAVVRDNLFVASLDVVSQGDRLTWLDARGALVPFADGATGRVVDEVPARPVLPARFHDCGRAAGGVVPKRIACGAEAKRYIPADGEPQYLSYKP